MKGEKLAQEYGKNYETRNLKIFRQFYLAFPIVYALRAQLTQTYVKILLPIKNENDINYYQVIINNLYYYLFVRKKTS